MRSCWRRSTTFNSSFSDESFIDFAYEDEQHSRRTLVTRAATLPNVMLVKSMSKDFGVAGLRAGYAIMNPDRVACAAR